MFRPYIDPYYLNDFSLMEVKRIVFRPENPFGFAVNPRGKDVYFNEKHQSPEGFFQNAGLHNIPLILEKTFPKNKGYICGRNRSNAEFKMYAYTWFPVPAGFLGLYTLLGAHFHKRVELNATFESLNFQSEICKRLELAPLTLERICSRFVEKGNNFFVECDPEQVLLELKKPFVSREEVYRFYDMSPDLMEQVSPSVRDHLMSIREDELENIGDDGKWEHLGGRDFRHRCCGATQRLTKTEIKHYREGKATRIRCLKCSVEGVVKQA